MVVLEGVVLAAIATGVFAVLIKNLAFLLIAFPLFLVGMGVIAFSSIPWFIWLAIVLVVIIMLVKKK